MILCDYFSHKIELAYFHLLFFYNTYLCCLFALLLVTRFYYATFALFFPRFIHSLITLVNFSIALQCLLKVYYLIFCHASLLLNICPLPVYGKAMCCLYK